MIKRQARPVIALDADGVLLDYHQSYRDAWHRAFGEIPEIRDPLAYWPRERWGVRDLEGNELTQFRSEFDFEFWSSIPPLPGAVEACRKLDQAGFELVCVSAIATPFESARFKNLQDCGFPINRVIATSGLVGVESPKAQALAELRAVAFVDDYLPFLRGIPTGIHTALVLREPNGSPNCGADLALAHSQHADLAAFADWWVADVVSHDVFMNEINRNTN